MSDFQSYIASVTIICLFGFATISHVSIYALASTGVKTSETISNHPDRLRLRPGV